VSVFGAAGGSFAIGALVSRFGFGVGKGGTATAPAADFAVVGWEGGWARIWPAVKSASAPAKSSILPVICLPPIRWCHTRAARRQGIVWHRPMAP
ncbi:MAG: hypothetical protein R3D44_13520, partial [Hyphomicrobiaceae bacterium]